MYWTVGILMYFVINSSVKWIGEFWILMFFIMIS